MTNMAYRFVQSQPVSATPTFDGVLLTVPVPFTGGEVEFAVLFAQSFANDTIWVKADMGVSETVPTVGGLSASYEGYLFYGGNAVVPQTVWSSVRAAVGIKGSGTSGDPGIVTIIFRLKERLHLLPPAAPEPAPVKQPARLPDIRMPAGIEKGSIVPIRRG